MIVSNYAVVISYLFFFSGEVFKLDNQRRISPLENTERLKENIKKKK